jgi:hypothetical protein
MSEAADFTVEVRDRGFVRLGQIAPEYTDLKFIDVHNGVGAWELKLPAEHPLLPDLKAKGSGIVVTEHWEDHIPQAPTYSEWAVSRQNMVNTPRPTAYAGSGWAAAGGSVATPGWITALINTTTTGYVFTGGSTEAIAAGDLVTLSVTYRVDAPGTGVATHIRATPHIRTGNVYIVPPLNELWVREITVGQEERVVIQWVADRAINAGDLDIALVTASFQGSFAAVTGGFAWRASELVIERGHTDGTFFDGSVSSTDPLMQCRWLGTANASPSVLETRVAIPTPDLIEHKYRVYSGRMRSARLSQNAADPAGTWVITGVDDNVIGAATRVYPDPIRNADNQQEAYWSLAGAAEFVMKRAVYLNAGTGALAARRYSWLQVAPSLDLGDQVKCSSRFDVLGDLLTSLGTAGGLGWEFRQSGSVVIFDTYVPQDKTGEVRLDIRNGGLESNELGFTAPSASEVLVLGQGEGEERTVRRVTSTEAAAEAVEWGIRWEQVKDQRNTDDGTELQQAGEEIIASLGSTVNSLKVVPSDAPGMALGRHWYRGDRITVVVDGQETTAIVTQVATSITSAGVIRQATVGDPVGFDFEAKMASKVKDVEQRIGQVERLVGQGVDWNDVTNRPTAFPSTWALISNGNLGRGTSAERDALYGIPLTDGTQAFLANRRVTWFNTDLGWEESYYAVDGTAGLVAPGLVAGVAPGWYPVGPGPRGKLQAIGSQNVSGTQYFTNWNNFGTGGSFRTGPQFVRPAGDTASLATTLPGRYDLKTRLTIPNGGGTLVWRFGYLDGETPSVMDQPAPLLASYGQIQFSEFTDVVLYTNGRIFVQTQIGSYPMNDAGAWMQLRYLGPALVSA